MNDMNMNGGVDATEASYKFVKRQVKHPSQ